MFSFPGTLLLHKKSIFFQFVVVCLLFCFVLVYKNKKDKIVTNTTGINSAFYNTIFINVVNSPTLKESAHLDFKKCQGPYVISMKLNLNVKTYILIT